MGQYCKENLCMHFPFYFQKSSWISASFIPKKILSYMPGFPPSKFINSTNISPASGI